LDDTTVKAKARNERSRAYLDEAGDPHSAKLYKVIRGDYIKKTSTLVKDNGEYTSNTNEILEEVEKAWLPVYNRHEESPPQFAIFDDKYRQYFDSFIRAPDELPNASDFYTQAKRAFKGFGWYRRMAPM
jgi:hypothetical protein